MESNKYQVIVFSEDDYNGDRDKLFDVVQKQLRILLDAGYIAVVRYDEPGLGIVIIEFEHDEHFDPWGSYNPIWVNPDEEDMIICNREGNCNTKADDLIE